mmetsp:Transcript_65054/g.163971  ORF Transcript_65054/g.163971 Transcript_65054/m.163971 type:complete len:298 (-) Transcript_65054:327-1220(-)
MCSSAARKPGASSISAAAAAAAAPPPLPANPLSAAAARCEAVTASASVSPRESPAPRRATTKLTSGATHGAKSAPKPARERSLQARASFQGLWKIPLCGGHCSVRMAASRQAPRLLKKSVFSQKGRPTSPNRTVASSPQPGTSRSQSDARSKPVGKPRISWSDSAFRKMACKTLVCKSFATNFLFDCASAQLVSTSTAVALTAGPGAWPSWSSPSRPTIRGSNAAMTGASGTVAAIAWSICNIANCSCCCLNSVIGWRMWFATCTVSSEEAMLAALDGFPKESRASATSAEILASQR